VNFEEYLVSKKIDANSFKLSENQLFESWKREFEQMHPNSFTAQKLNLINPVRRKYPLKAEEKSIPETATGTAAVAPKPARPMMKPKPKIN
jgi:hypothetical protein